MAEISLLRLIEKISNSTAYFVCFRESNDEKDIRPITIAYKCDNDSSEREFMNIFLIDVNLTKRTSRVRCLIRFFVNNCWKNLETTLSKKMFKEKHLFN